ncbi:PPIP5K1 [Symbiodinium natans]|uniref:PPIP5K1 protein n=1 Tax=Symbiodinium natans TaxID=878477 RepID=A0A812MLT9_9DINO|nr:PPIP5K1 [Symbiodinium natans]
MAKINVGICCMKKKLNSDSMAELLQRLQATGKFVIIRFKESMILHEPVENWPVVSCLLAFASTGFPLPKAIQYQKLRNPWLVNALEEQEILTDRVQMYARLSESAIPCPPHMIIDHGSATPGDLVQDTDSITWRGQVLPKPFVEKPQDADDHAVWIYHSSGQGGGATKLHRKKANQSSIRDFSQSQIRENGMFVYEPFMETGGLDIKVYAVGESYVHAEVRKAPGVDGRVERDGNGKEIRQTIELTPEEKIMSRMVVKAFKQSVCGFDILRTTDGRSLVCDVNGFSFVKGNKDYFDNAAASLTAMLVSTAANPPRTPLPHRIRQKSWFKAIGRLCSLCPC